MGLLSSAAEYILHLASYYLKVDLVREDRLHVFLKIPKKDPDSVLFALAIGGDGAITWEKDQPVGEKVGGKFRCCCKVFKNFGK